MTSAPPRPLKRPVILVALSLGAVLAALAVSVAVTHGGSSGQRRQSMSTGDGLVLSDFHATLPAAGRAVSTALSMRVQNTSATSTSLRELEVKITHLTTLRYSPCHPLRACVANEGAHTVGLYTASMDHARIGQHLYVPVGMFFAPGGFAAVDVLLGSSFPGRVIVGFAEVSSIAENGTRYPLGETLIYVANPPKLTGGHHQMVPRAASLFVQSTNPVALTKTRVERELQSRGLNIPSWLDRGH